MPHMVVCGATKCGKSVQINVILASLLMQNNPHQLQLLLVDPKLVEFSMYEGLPHLYKPVITDPQEGVNALADLCTEMDTRYELMAKKGFKNWNEFVGTRCIDEEGYARPRILCVIDEFADLIMQSKDVEEHVIRLAQKARGAGIHLILCTQKLYNDFLPRKIQANIPARIALTTASENDNELNTEMNKKDAPRCDLLGKYGEGYFIMDGKSLRFQGAFIPDSEIENVCNWWRDKDKCMVD